MREILFRGKRLDNGQWVTSSCLANVETESDETIWYIGAGNPTLIGFDKNGNILESVTQRDCTHYKVDPATVGQYTGLKDKNGKRIFEGDIWDCNGCKGVIEWAKEACSFEAHYMIGGTEYVNAVSDYRAGRVEIIGNIHDNPELLEGVHGA